MTWNLIDTRNQSVIMTAIDRKTLRNKAIRAGLIKFERGKSFNHLILGAYDIQPEGFIAFDLNRIKKKVGA